MVYSNYFKQDRLLTVKQASSIAYLLILEARGKGPEARN